MHGQKRAEYKARLRDPVVSKKLEQKAQQWNTLTQTLLQKRKTKLEITSEEETLPTEKVAETLALTEKLLTVNPDPSYLWNIRRELLHDTDNQEFLKQEQILTQTALSNNPKAYGAWFHRKWCIQKYCNDETIENDKTIMLHAELILCSEFLRLDERNFHCWNYRRFIVGVLMELYACKDGMYNGEWIWKQNADIIFGAQMHSRNKREASVDYTNNVDIQELIESEWNFTLEKIEQNFSNGSAFHYRSKLLPIMLNLKTCDNVDVWECKVEYLQQELELIRNAVFTEPDDQTAWWYLRFIITWANPCNHKDEQENKEAIDMFHKTLFEEWNTIQELAESEEHCKWALLGLHMISSEMLKLQDAHSFEGDVDWHDVSNDYLERLKQLDVDRLARYESIKM